jgi:hypothetical protein
MRLPIIVLLPAIVAACEPTPGWNGSIESLLMSQPDRFSGVMQNPEKFRLQIVYTQIDRDNENQPSFKTFAYRLDPTEYFYPASTVKLPTVALALEKLNRLDRPGLDIHTTMLTGSAADYQTEARADETSPTGLPNVANYVRKILLVSDNDAFNRLYEFVGQEEINTSLRDKGYADTRIVHRLERALDKSQNQWTNPVQFMNGDELTYQQEAISTETNFYGTEPQLLGLAEIVNGDRLERPKNFSEKNAYALLNQHDVIKNLMFPQSVDQKQRFHLSEDDYRFMYRYMSMYPSESGIDAYDDIDKYPQGYVKFLMFGGDEKQIPSHIRIFNKVGNAYGFLTDAAYIVDFKNNVEFLLSATIYTNENQTFNDNNYEYDEIALPFLRNLGQSIYEIELKRPRQNAPDLSRFHFPDRDY